MPNLAPLAVFIFLALLPPGASAQPGSLDPTFGVGGKLVTTIPNGSAFTTLPDGKFLVLGNASYGPGIPSDLEVYRLFANGSPDSTFGIDGRTVIDFDDISPGNYEFDEESSIVVLDNDKIVIGRAPGQWRAHPDFGMAGKLSRRILFSPAANRRHPGYTAGRAAMMQKKVSPLET